MTVSPTTNLPSPPVAAAVHRLVTYAHTQDVGASLDFYARLGFAPVTVLRDPAGNAFWALAQSGAAEIMFARASGPVDAGVQAVLFYMYSHDVAALRQCLIESGIRDAGPYSGRATSADAPACVFAVSHPAHMPAGELRVIDPDGYVILVGQLA